MNNIVTLKNNICSLNKNISSKKQTTIKNKPSSIKILKKSNNDEDSTIKYLVPYTKSKISTHRSINLKHKENTQTLTTFFILNDVLNPKTAYAYDTLNDLYNYSLFNLAAWILPMTIAGRLLGMSWKDLSINLCILGIIKTILEYYHIIHY